MTKLRKNDFGIGQRNRKSEVHPIFPRGHDNDLSSLMKLIQGEVERHRGKLPPVEEDLFFYQRGESQLGIIPAVTSEISTLGYGSVVTLTFDEHNENVTPTVPGINGPADPRPQLDMHGLGMIFSTPVYNFPQPGQDRFVTPFGGSSRIDPMGGGAISNVFRVASDDDYAEIVYSDKLITLPNGESTPVFINFLPLAEMLCPIPKLFVNAISSVLTRFKTVLSVSKVDLGFNPIWVCLEIPLPAND